MREYLFQILLSLLGVILGILAIRERLRRPILIVSAIACIIVAGLWGFIELQGKPQLTITAPTDALACPAGGPCVVTIKGASTGVNAATQTIVVWVDPGGGNWWPQNLDYPVVVYGNGDWEGQAQFGDQPQASGARFHLAAVVMDASQAPRERRAYQVLPDGSAAAGPLLLTVQ